MWEDAANKQGGRWVITLNKSSKSDLDNLWLDVVSVTRQKKYQNNLYPSSWTKTLLKLS